MVVTGGTRLLFTVVAVRYVGRDRIETGAVDLPIRLIGKSQYPLGDDIHLYFVCSPIDGYSPTA